MPESVSVKGFVPYARVPLWLLRHGRQLKLQATDVAVYAALMSYADNRTGFAWPGIEALAERSLSSPQTVRRSLRRLEAAGVVEVERSAGGAPHAYHIGFADPAKLVGIPSQSGRGTRPKADTQPAAAPPSQSGIAAAALWVDAWAELRGVQATAQLRRTWVEQVLQLEAAGVAVTEELLATAHQRGIEQPAGWVYAQAGNGRPAEPGPPDPSPPRNAPDTCPHMAVDAGGFCAGCMSMVGAE